MKRTPSDMLLTCAFGTDWATHENCPSCAAESLRLDAAFLAGVEAGTWDQDGYTPAERRAQAKKKATA